MSENNKEELEIDLLELGKKLWSKKKFIIRCSIIGAIVGIIIAFSIPKEYTTTVILTTESGKSAGSGMGALASMAGINLSTTNGDEVFSPELYPDVLNSTPFIQGLLDIEVIDEAADINTSLYLYLKEGQKSPWWSYILGMPSKLFSLLSTSDSEEKTIPGNNSRHISRTEMSLIEKVKSSYTLTTDKKTGVTRIELTAQNPTISAFLADTLTSYLQSYIIDQRTKKAKKDLANSQKLYEQAKENYYKSQQNVATFTDANMNVISAKYKINQEKLQNEAAIAYSIYNQMAQQVQMNKIKVQDNTPVFTIIQPAVEPIYPTKPKKMVIVVAFILLSIISTSCWILRIDILNMVGPLSKSKHE